MSDNPHAVYFHVRKADLVTMLVERDAALADLKDKDARWREIVKDELACTFMLIEAMGIVQEVESGRAVQDAMLAWIADAKSAQASLAQAEARVKVLVGECVALRAAIPTPPGLGDWVKIADSPKLGLFGGELITRANEARAATDAAGALGRTVP